MPFKFYCRNCNQKLEAPEEIYGQEIECPQCSMSIIVPDPNQLTEKPRELLSETSMACPLCGFPSITMPDSQYGTAKCSNCQSAIPLECSHEMATSKLPVLHEYYIVRKLGKGGTGSVYEARQVKLNNRSVAIKILSQDMSSNWDISTEVSALVRLSHPYIVRIFDVTHTDNVKGIVMELITAPHCEPLSLRDILTANNGTLSLEATVKTAQTICNALDYAHKQKVLHLDLKPENVLVDHLGMLRIVDFGISKLRLPRETRNGLKIRTMSDSDIYGTPGYIAPERRDPNVPPSPSMDIFSLGAILYEMLTGEVPGGRFQLPSEIDDKMPKVLDSIIESSLNFHAEKRFSTMADFGEALNNALNIIRAGGNITGKHAAVEVPHGMDNTMRIQRSELFVSPGFDLPETVEDKKKDNKLGAFTYVMIGMLCAFVMVVVTTAILKTNESSSDSNFKPEKIETTPVIQGKVPALTQTNKSQPKPEIKETASKQEPTPKELFNKYQNLYWGKNTKRNDDKAFVLLKKAADMKYPPAVNRLGELFFYEESGFDDPKRALKLFREAAEKDNPKALYNLGECYYYGLCGLTKDYVKAIKYYSRASALGQREATFALGRCYKRGHGFERSNTRSLILFRQAAAEGYAPAQEIISLTEKITVPK